MMVFVIFVMFMMFMVMFAVIVFVFVSVLLRLVCHGLCC